MTRRRKLLLGGAAVLVAGAGIGIGFAVTSGPPKVTTKAPKVFTPPKTVNKSCTADDTQSLGTWLLSVPDGTPGHNSVAKLAKGACYEVDGSIWWRGPHNIVLDGNGATIRQGAIAPTTPWVTAGGHNDSAVAPYCGSTAYMNDLYSAPVGQPHTLGVEGGCDLTIENLTIKGTHRAGGDPAPGSFYQPASFITFYGTQRALVNHVTESGPYGDFIENSGLHEAGGDEVNYPSTDITIENSSFANAGRTGVSETNGAHRILITHDTFNGANLTMFDIELDAVYKAPEESDIDITHNTIVGQHYGFLVAAITGSEVQRVAFTDNTLTRGAQMRIWFQPQAFAGGVSNNVAVKGNKSTAASTWPNRSPVNIFNMANVLVADNVDPPPIDGGAGRPFAHLTPGDPTNLACGNTDPTHGTALDGPCPATLPVITPPEVAVLPS